MVVLMYHLLQCMLLHSDWLLYYSNNIFKLLFYADFLVISTMFIYECITYDTCLTCLSYTIDGLTWHSIYYFSRSIYPWNR